MSHSRLVLPLLYMVISASCALRSPDAVTQASQTDYRSPSQDSDDWYRQSLAVGLSDEQKIDYLTRAVELRPDFAAAYLQRGYANQRLVRSKDAIADFERALAINPQLAEAQAAIAKSFRSMGQMDAAQKALDAAIRLEPRLDFFLQRAELNKERNRFSAAVQDYNQVLVIDPKNIETLIARGVCYQKLNQHARAVQDYLQALELRPDDPSLYYNLGSIYWVQGKWPETVAAWEKCLTLDPKHPRAGQYLPLARKRAGL